MYGNIFLSSYNAEVDLTL